MMLGGKSTLGGPAAAPVPKRCDNCDHWAAGEPIFVRDEIIGHTGDCRRHAPVVLVNRFDVAKTHWPETEDGERCGDWEPATS